LNSAFLADPRLPPWHALFHENEHTASDVLISLAPAPLFNAIILMTLTKWDSRIIIFFISSFLTKLHQLLFA
jgi:hypothetical protein